MMGKLINNPEIISNTPIVEELFKNMKNAPEKNQLANAANSSKGLEKDFFDVVNLTGINPDEQKDKNQESSLPEQEKKADENPDDKLSDEDTEEEQTIFNKKGKLLDIEG